MGCMSCAKGKFLQAHPFSYPLWAQPKDPIFNKDTAGMGEVDVWDLAPPTSGPEDLRDGQPNRSTCLFRHWTSVCLLEVFLNITFLRWLVPQHPLRVTILQLASLLKWRELIYWKIPKLPQSYQRRLVGKWISFGVPRLQIIWTFATNAAPSEPEEFFQTFHGTPPCGPVVSKGDQDCGRRHLPPQRRFTSALFASDDWLIWTCLNQSFPFIQPIINPKDDPESHLIGCLWVGALQNLVLHASPCYFESHFNNLQQLQSPHRSSITSCHIVPHLPQCTVGPASVQPGSSGCPWVPVASGCQAMKAGALGKLERGAWAVASLGSQPLKRMEFLGGTD